MLTQMTRGVGETNDGRRNDFHACNNRNHLRRDGSGGRRNSLTAASASSSSSAIVAPYSSLTAVVVAAAAGVTPFSCRMTNFSTEMLTDWNDAFRNMCAMGLILNNNNNNKHCKACGGGNANDGGGRRCTGRTRKRRN